MKSRYVLLSLLVAPLLFAGCKMGSLLGTDSTPSQLTVGGPTSDSLIVRWTPVAGAVSYEVFRDTLTTGVFGTRAYHGGATSFADSGLAAGTTYYYKVQATTPAGSGPLSAVASGRTIPPAPEGLTAGESTTISLTVTWTAANGAESYSLFRDSSSTGPFTTQVYQGSAARYTDAGLIPGTTYCYRVLAANASGASALCAAVSGTTFPAPLAPAPTGLTVGSPTVSSLAVSWNASDGAISYLLFRDDSSTGAFTTQVYMGPAPSYADTGLAAGTTYYYRVLAANATGSGALSEAAAGTTSMPPIPAVPAGLAVGSPGVSSLAVTWNASSGAASYELFRDTSATGAFSTQVYSGTATSNTDAGLATATTYFYKVRATNASGSSALSGAASGTTSPPPIPPAPGGLAVGNPTVSSLSISWNAASGATSYQLFRDTSLSGAFTTQLYSGSATTYTDPGLAASTTYFYKVRSTNASGSSPVSAAVSGTTSALPIPPAPAGLAVGSPTTSSLAVSWSASSGAASYQLFRDTSSGGTFSTQVYTGSATSCTDSGLAASTRYYYRAQATNASGSSALSAAASGTTSTPPVPPTPTGLAVGTPTVSSLGITWNPSGGAASYQVYRDTSATGAFATQVYTGAAASCTDTGLATSTTYYYKVRATNASGSSALSASVPGTTSGTGAPPTPTSLAAGSPTTSSLAIGWNAASGATSYQLFRDSSATGAFTLQIYLGAATSFTDTGLAASTTYYYKVLATNASGSSALSAAASGTTSAPPIPQTPTGLAIASPTVSSLALTWNAVSGATSYQLFRDSSATGAFTTQVYTGAAASCTDTGLAASTTYYYKVRATNASGSSALSAAVGGATSAVPVPPTPTGLGVGSPTASSLAVSWNAASGATSYQLFRDSSATGAFATQVYLGAATSYTDTGLAASTTYYYQVLATNASGSSARSPAASGTTSAPPVPPTPTGLAVGSPTASSLAVSWNAASGATSYQLFRDSSATGAFATQVYTGAAAAYADTGLAAGSTYYYKVRATNASGSSALSAAVSGTTTSSTPPTPTGLAIGSPTPIALTVSWSAAAGATSYQVFRDVSSTGAFTTQRYSGSALTFTDTPLNSSTTYYYKVRATSTSGSSALSAAVPGTTAAPTRASCITSCHNASAPPNPASSGAHSFHTAYACDRCHHDYQTLPAHGNGILDATGLVRYDSTQPSGGYVEATSTCTSISCHGNRAW